MAQQQEIKPTQAMSKTPAVVFLHGFCETGAIWNTILPYFPEEWHCITITLPGHEPGAETETTETRLPATLDEYAHLVVQQLKDRGVHSFVCIGHSLGGYVALHIAKHYPGVLLGLCLFQSMPFADNNETKENRNRQITLLREGKKQGVIDGLITRIFSEQLKAKHPEVVDAMRTTMMMTPTNGMIAALTAMRERVDVSDVLLLLPIPVLLYLGELDPIVSPQKIAALYATAPHVPKNLQLIIQPGIAHMAMLENPRRAAAVLQFFLRTVFDSSEYQN